MELFKDYFEDTHFVIKDLGLVEDMKYLFILESPHKEEIKKRYPAAGETGKDMAEFLKISKSKGKSLGLLVEEGKVKKVGIINVSPVPLQQTEDFKNKEMEGLLETLDKIRLSNTRYGEFQNNDWNIYEKAIHESFLARIGKVLENENGVYQTDIMYIVCGKFAQKHFELIKSKFPEKLTHENVLIVPHPARHNWTRVTDDMIKLRDIKFE